MKQRLARTEEKAARWLAAATVSAIAAISLLLAMAPFAGAGVEAQVAGGAAAAEQTYGPGVPIEQRLFPSDNPWNTDISGYPVDPGSARYLTRIGLGTSLHADFGTVWNGAPNGIPYVVVPGSQPQVPIELRSTATRATPGRTRSRPTRRSRAGPSGTATATCWC